MKGRGVPPALFPSLFPAGWKAGRQTRAMGKDKVEEYRPQQPHRLYRLTSLGVEGQKTKVSLACLSQYYFGSLLQQTFLYLQNRKLCEDRE